MNRFSSSLKARLFAPAAIAFLAVLTPVTVADTLPSGERQIGQSILEPAYNDLDGSLTYLLTPIKAPEKANGHAVAPLYVIMYPTAVAAQIGTVSCQHQPGDNCPDHGPALAGLAEAMVPGVYGAGVWGHDHILTAPPGAPHAGGDFNVAWLPVAVLFTSPEAASNHITTLSQLNAAIAAGQVMTIPLPAATFHCSAVASAPYDNATPVPLAPPLP
ncbi:MAG: hypothetical protein LAO51_03340 [Acidobacteriia bacterium]|nr:hypothetical protein [Terriglobia bacterium]